ncbi:SoxY-related AACIE arm protein [Massilia psychrophila]|uniref:SoxY-related AACIE arm protein n=1 Tax=Massilia psychrophila TaxID=1603353 RepID=A0A2G8T6P5_9BURK|nr:SoxY-related AACIE arm protein [Massilia psychrophila]PIL41716.1 SoxY-related AACIE arm protein [Massilia psychrophila]GGE60787.1 sulfur oxidation protein SoxY [Massilia psychrophila]
MTAIDKLDRSRRKALAGLGALLLVPVGPACATPEKMAAAIDAFTGAATPRRGGITLEVASLVDNGNTVPITVRVDSPMTAIDHVAAIAVFNERNPETGVAVFTLGARAGKAEVSTRIRMATSQKLVAVARMSDGSFRIHSADVVVALAACIEGEA